MAKISSEQVRRSAIAGSWYPGAASPLKSTVDGYLDQVEKLDLGGDLIGLIAPHAGYMYSGQVAAFAYRQLHGRDFHRVVVISPMHRAYLGRFAATDKAYYETPLGLVKVDGAALQSLSEKIEISAADYDTEHSLEIQLPFLQRLLPDFELLPIMMGAQDLASCQSLAKAVAQTVGAPTSATTKTLLVASTDLSHFHTQHQAKVLDQVFLNDVEAFDAEKLARDLASGDTEACGGGPVVTVMLAAQRLGANRAQILKYATSGDVTGDYSNVVGYAAGVLFRSLRREP
jgi:AmmeMemoRadiSam system protein B